MKSRSLSDSPREPAVTSNIPKRERSKPSVKKPSSFYMKQMRAGLASTGYVGNTKLGCFRKNRSLLKQMEQQLRQPGFWLAHSCRRIT